jgi:8-oxo-dGTP diphosphatase
MAVQHSSSRRAPVSVDVVVMTCRERHLCVLADSQGSGKQRSLVLPYGTPSAGEPLDVAAARIAKQASGRSPSWIEQAGAFGDGTDHPGHALLSVCYVALVPSANNGAMWLTTQPIPSFRERQRRMVSGAVDVVRSRLEQAPIAFSMLPREFTLSELQETYETILGRRLHKASFRRALQAAFLVEPTGEWRGEGRGRPAQLYRYAPRRRKGIRRGVRLDLL